MFNSKRKTSTEPEQEVVQDVQDVQEETKKAKKIKAPKLGKLILKVKNNEKSYL